MAHLTIRDVGILKINSGALCIGTDVGSYSITAEQLEDFLIEDGQMCEFCFDTREIIEDGVDADGNVERGTVTRKCPHHD